MSTKVKVGIAGIIVAALVALIVLDQKTGPKDEKSAATETPNSGIGLRSTEATEPRRAGDETESFNILERARERFRTEMGPTPPADRTPARSNATIRGTEVPPPGKQIDPIPSAASEEYVIQAGDTYADIAEKKYGDRHLWQTIADANPSMKPNAMRVGKKIAIPAKPGKNVDEPVVGGTMVNPIPVPSNAGSGPKTYVVQAGDTLMGISQKNYGTARNHEKIFDANRDKLQNPNDLVVGMKLTLPEISAAAPRPANVGEAPVVMDTNGKKTHKVQPNDSLWKIAEKNAGDRGIMETLSAIVKANPDKLKNESTMLRVGWSLVIPE